MIKAIIFDRDGVLIDSEYANILATETTLKRFNIPLLDVHKDLIAGRHPDDYLPLILKDQNIDIAKYKEARRNEYYKILNATPFFDRTISLIKKLHSKNTTLALCTSAGRQGTINLLEKMGITKLFDIIVAKEDCVKRKPDPEPYLTTTKMLGLKPQECLVIEDSAVGLKSALAAKMKCIIIFNEYTEKHDFSGATLVVDSADKIDIDEILRC